MRTLSGLVARPSTVLGSAVVGLALAVLAAAPAGAETQVRNGSINNADPTMPVVSIDGSNDVCTTEGSFPVHYEVQPYTAKAAGDYRLTLTEAGTHISFYVYEDSFDPTDPLDNCIAADNSVDNGAGEKIVDVHFDDNRRYFFVIFDDAFAQDGGDYRFEIDTPDGVATEVARGAGKRFVQLPATYSCGQHKAVAIWKNPAHRVKSAKFLANGRLVAQTNRARPGGRVVLRDLPNNTHRIKAVIKLRNGSKVRVTRSYLAC